MKRPILFALSLTLGLMALFVVAFTLVESPGVQAASDSTASCLPFDVDCDGMIDIVALQSIAARYGAAAGTGAYDPALDLDGDGVIDADDLLVGRAAWRLPGGPVDLAGGPPRLGYAVNPNGHVFLRWVLPVSPYSATVEVIRQPAPPGAPSAGRPGVGVIAAVDPIYDDATALPLLGDQWELLRTAFTSDVDADGNPIAVNLNSVAEMHTYAQAGTNPFIVQALSNEDPGVARVMGKGYFDTDLRATGQYTYWVRVNGRMVGPVRIDTTSRTQLPAPGAVTAFEGTVNTPTTGFTDPILLRMKRGAHAAVYLGWDPSLPRRVFHPEWHNGFNVWRQECDPGGANCGGWVQVNDLPVFPKVDPDGLHDAESLANSAGVSVNFGVETHEFDWFWADFELNTAKEYCYYVTALDLLGQDGTPSPLGGRHCLQPPDYEPPTTPENVGVNVTYNGAGNLHDIRINWRHDALRNADVATYRVYRAPNATHAWPISWTLVAAHPPQLRPAQTATDRGKPEHYQQWYRVTGVDAAGNESVPSPPALATVDDIYPPHAPYGVQCPPQDCWPNRIGLPDDTAYVRVYRSFSEDGLKLLIDRVPANRWNSWQDSYQPPYEMTVYYYLVAEDAVGNLSDYSTAFPTTLGLGQVIEIATPVITGTTWSKVGGQYQAQLHWSLASAIGATRFIIYRSQGEDPPDSTSEMTEIHSGNRSSMSFGEGDLAFSYTDDSSDLQPNQLYWYVVVASGFGGLSEKPSQPFATRYIDLDADFTRELADLFLHTEVIMNEDGLTIKGVQLNIGVQGICCFVFLRSHSGTGDFTQISPIVTSQSYFDTDVYRGMTAHYQALWIDAARFDFPLDYEKVTGEILGATPVIEVEIPGFFATPPDPVKPPPQTALPPQAPSRLLFGPDWPVQVRSYDAGSTQQSMSGDGAVLLEVGPGDIRPTRVRFENIAVDSPSNDGGTSKVAAINSGGSVIVEIGNFLIPTFPDRMLVSFAALRLDENGAEADIGVLDAGPGLTLWNVAAPAPGYPFILPVNGLRIKNPSLEYERVVTPPPGQDCSGSLVVADFPFAVTNWPLLLVPTGTFTVTQSGIDFSSTCTQYRERYSGLMVDGFAVPEALDYRNDYLLQPVYTGAAAVYSVSGGLSGIWASTGAHSYQTAYPFGFTLTSEDRQFRLTGGQITGGLMQSGTLSFDYATEVSPDQKATFHGAFDTLSIGRGGAIYGPISGNAINWTAFTIDFPDYELYIPAALTRDQPSLSWPARQGTAASGVNGDGWIDPGLNAGNRDLEWGLCPGASSTTVRFQDNGVTAADLYVRRGGVTGHMDLTPLSPETGKLAGYDTSFNRFAMSWLDNLSLESGITGKFILPYPADIELSFDSLWLDTNGCVMNGSVLPQRQVLDYWQVPVIPRIVDLRPTTLSLLDLSRFKLNVYRLWILGDYEIENLVQAEGAQENLIEIEVAFNPNGTFADANIFPEETVYRVDDFYVVLNDLRLSSYSVSDPGASEKPAWDTSITLEAPPAEFGAGPVTGNAGFVELTAGIYFPFFGEVTDPNDAHIYLLGERPYIGFDQRPAPAKSMSQALNIQLAYDMAYAQGAGEVSSRWVGVARSNSRSLSVGGETLATMPHSLVVEPHQEQITFGFPAVSALFLAADEAYLSWPGRASGGRQSRFESWRGDLLLGDSLFNGEAALATHLIEAKGISKYGNLIGAIDTQVAAHDGIVSNWIDASLNNAHVQTSLFTSILVNSPLQSQWMRGSTMIEPIYDDAGRVIDGKLNKVDVAIYAKIYTGERAANANDGTQSPLLKGQMVMVLDPQGSIYLGAQGVKGEVLQQELSFDVDFLLLFGDPVLGYGIEGGLTLYNLKTAVADVDKAGAVAGFTLLKNPSKIGLLYVGAALDLKIDVQTIGKINVGGSVLFGRLDPGSPVLAAEYGDLFAQMSAPAGSIIQGAYMRVYANNIPIFKVGVGCLGIDISGGGEVAWWIFTQDGLADNAWGTRLGVSATGKAFCVASAKASITLTLDNDFGQSGLDLTGDAWAGAGCGFCKPENWHTKADVLNDKGCLKCIIDLYFVIPMKGSATKSKLDFNAACPF